MGDWRDFPLPDGSYSDETRPWTQQDVCNYLPTFAEGPGTRSRIKYATVPGLRTWAVVGDGPHRGARDVEGKRFVVSGNKLYQVATTGIATLLGTIPGTRRVSMTHNQIAGGNELVIATGDNSYVWNTVAGTLTATGVPLLFVDFINQMIVGIDVARRFWRYSGLADATSWNALDNESAESSPDRLVGQLVSQGEVLLFGERTIEVWSNSPTDNTSFQRSTVIEKGCANGNTCCRLDNTVYFVGNDSIPYRLQGYTPVPIASKAITEVVSGGDPDKLFAFTWEDRGYVVYYLTAQDGNTWGYDVTCQKWHRRESFGLSRWRINTLVKWGGSWYAGDYSSGKMYLLEWGLVYEGDDIFPRSIRTGVMHSDGNRISIHALRLFAATGAASSAPGALSAVTVSGDVQDGAVGESASGSYTATGGVPPYTYAVTSGSLPSGLTLGAGGPWTGAFDAAGSYGWTITATDADGNTGSLPDASEVTDQVMPAQSQWRYLQVASSDTEDYSATDYDDSEWATGPAPFGGWEAGSYDAQDILEGAPTAYNPANAYDARFVGAFATAWAANTSLWIRRTITLGVVPPGGIALRTFIDDHLTLYINGVEVATTPAGSPSGNGQLISVASPNLVVGDNVVAVRCNDEPPDSGISVVYVDLILEAE